MPPNKSAITNQVIAAAHGLLQFYLELTLSVPVSYQHPTSPYITHTKYLLVMRIDQTKQTTED